MRYNTNKKTFRLFAIATAFIVMALVSACGGKTDRADGTDTVRLKRLSQIDDSIVKRVPNMEAIVHQGMKNAKDSITYYEYYLRLARIYWLSTEPERVDACVRRIEAFCKREMQTKKGCENQSRLNSLLAGAYNCLAAVNHNFHRDREVSVPMYKKALSLLKNSDNKEEMPKTYANLGDAYIQCSDIPEAARCYRRALFLVDSLRMPEQENVTLYMGLAQIYLTLGDERNALKYYRATEKHYSDMTPAMQSYYLCNCGNFYYFTKDYPSALKMFLRMKRQLEDNKLQDHFDMYLCKINLADVYLNMDSLAQSKRMLDEVEPFFRRVGDVTANYYCNTIRIGLAVKEHDIQKVAKILATEKPDDAVPYMMVNIRNRYLRQYYALKGDYRKAYTTLEEDVAYTDSLEHNKSKMRSAEIMARFQADTTQLHHDIAIEQKNAVIQKANTKVSIAVSVVLVLVLIMVVWLMRMKKKRVEYQVDILNLKLLNMRNRISPHFVFNVLNNKIGSSDEKEASELVALSKLIRANLDMSLMPSITLDREMDYLHKYITLERYLLGDDFTFRLDICEGLDMSTINMPSMFLQILTENAIVHGLKGWEGHKELSISITRQPVNDEARDGAMQTVVTVTDNGPGFNHLRLKKKTGLGVITQTIAVTNQRNRRKMRFDIHNITDKEGKVKGCQATLAVPDGIRF